MTRETCCKSCTSCKSCFTCDIHLSPELQKSALLNVQRADFTRLFGRSVARRVQRTKSSKAVGSRMSKMIPNPKDRSVARRVQRTKSSSSQVQTFALSPQVYSCTSCKSFKSVKEQRKKTLDSNFEYISGYTLYI